MKRVFDFIQSLTPNVIDVLGYPTIKVYSDLVEVYFETSFTIRSFPVFDFKGADSFRMFALSNTITIVFSFNITD